MSRLWRGLWRVEVRRGEEIIVEPRHFALPYDDAAKLAPTLGEEGWLRAHLRRDPGSRAAWETVACFEASDPPRWGDEGDS